MDGPKEGVCLYHPILNELSAARINVLTGSSSDCRSEACRKQWDGFQDEHRRVIRALNEKARTGGGEWIYMWPEPGGSASSAKLGYVKAVPIRGFGRVQLGSGMYWSLRIDESSTGAAR